MTVWQRFGVGPKRTADYFLRLTAGRHRRVGMSLSFDRDYALVTDTDLDHPVIGNWALYSGAQEVAQGLEAPGFSGPAPAERTE